MIIWKSYDMKLRLSILKIYRSIAWAHFAPIGEGYDIIYIYVELEHRGKGFAKRMIGEFVERVRPKEMMLEVRKTNEVAINLYRGMAFEVISERKGYYRDGEDAWVMKKRLLTHKS